MPFQFFITTLLYLHTGKWLHDQEGGLMKKAEAQCVKDGTLKWDQHDTYSGAVIAALTKKFDDAKYNKVKRYFFEIHANKISSMPSPHKSLKGVKTYFTYLMGYKKNHVYCRRYPCECDYCCKGEWNKCTAMYVCGTWHPHQFKNLPYPKPDMKSNDPENVDINMVGNNSNNARNTNNNSLNTIAISSHQINTSVRSSYYNTNSRSIPSLQSGSNNNHSYGPHIRDARSANPYSPYS